MEAVKIGYKLLSIHEYIEFDLYQHVFKKYIGKIFKIKDDNKNNKNSAMYVAAKLLMNALSGTCFIGIECFINTCMIKNFLMHC